MDLNRFMRAKAAKGMEVLEGRRRAFMAGKLDAADISAGEWKRITEMDEIAAQG